MEPKNYQQDEGLRSLIRIESKQDLVLFRLDAQARQTENLALEIEKTKKRVDKVESKVNHFAAYFAGAVAVVTTIWMVFKDNLRSLFNG